MQKLIDQIPLLLLIVLVPFFYYNSPNIAQSIIVGVISALVGYRYYLESIKMPDFVKLFTERLDAKDREINEILKDFHKEVKEVKDGQNKIAIVKNQEDKAKNFSW